MVFPFSGRGLLFTFSFSILLLFSLFAAPAAPRSALPGTVIDASASEKSLPSCQTIYGGGENCLQSENITISKSVLNPQTLKYVENLADDDPKYNPDQIAQFQITVKNTSNKSIKDIKVKDLLPQYVDCASGGTGQCDNATKIITFSINALNANEIKTFILKAKITSKNKLADKKEVICLVNQAIAIESQQKSQDNSQFCIQKNTTLATVNQTSTKGGLPVYPPAQAGITPQTGPQAAALIGLISAGLLGLILRNKTA